MQYRQHSDVGFSCSSRGTYQQVLIAFVRSFKNHRLDPVQRLGSFECYLTNLGYKIQKFAYKLNVYFSPCECGQVWHLSLVVVRLNPAQTTYRNTCTEILSWCNLSCSKRHKTPASTFDPLNTI